MECPWCGTEFVRRSNRQIYCSYRCQGRASYEQLGYHPKRKSLDDRFFAKVHMTSECWWWTGAKDRQGYGQMGIGGRRANGGSTPSAHRVSYEAIVGPVPPGLELDHLCRNRSCVRPEHLEPVTRKENCRRSPLIGRWDRRR